VSFGGRVQRGSLVVFPVPSNVSGMVSERRYLPAGALLVKPIVALADDHVCTAGGVLSVNGMGLGIVQRKDSEGRPLPHSEVCGDLPAGWAFVASHFAMSFDSRTFGPVPVASIRGTVTPLWTY
jgi:type IV secretory pathway protease TraF